MQSKIKKFNVRPSINRSSEKGDVLKGSVISYLDHNYQWSDKMERMEIVRQGIAVGSIEVVGSRIAMPVSKMLKIIDIPQTTYNKGKRENASLDSRDSEMIVLLNELIDFGTEVFNHEDQKFQRWLRKRNVSLGNNSPEELLDTITGILEVKNALNRIETANFA